LEEAQQGAGGAFAHGVLIAAAAPDVHAGQYRGDGIHRKNEGQTPIFQKNTNACNLGLTKWNCYGFFSSVIWIMKS